MMLILFLLDYQTDVIKILDVLRNPALVYVLPSLYLDFFSPLMSVFTLEIYIKAIRTCLIYHLRECKISLFTSIVKLQKRLSNKTE
jgi:hypothetical protein